MMKKLFLRKPMKDAAVLMFENGRRAIEIFRLRREAVDSLQVTSGKTKASIRQVHLSDKAKAILKARLKRFDGDFLFPHNDKDGENPASPLDKRHRKAIGDLGFTFRLGDCRHTFATCA